MQAKRIIDAHSHLFQVRVPTEDMVRSTEEVKGFDANEFVKLTDEAGIVLSQAMPQCLERRMLEWMGSNDLCADLGKLLPEKIYACGSGEPLDWKGSFNRAHFEDIKQHLVNGTLKGIALAPPYGHWRSNDRRAYPWYELAVEQDAHTHTCMHTHPLTHRVISCIHCSLLPSG